MTTGQVNPNDTRTDAELFEAINRGDAIAFNTLYYRHRDWIMHLASRFTGDREIALDCLQETFGYLLRKRPNLQLTAKLSTYLYPVVKHIAIAMQKKQRRLQYTTELPEPVAPKTPADPTTHMLPLLSDLPESHREIIQMRFIDDMSLQQIAMALQIPLGTAKSRLHHAIAKLKDSPQTKKYFL